MNRAADLVADALSVGLLLSRHGEHIHIDSPLGQPLPGDLRERLAAHRDEVLAWLDWCVSADALLLECSRRLAARCPSHYPLDDDEWTTAEEALAEAHRSQDPAVLREALARYERFALAKFSAYERGVR